MNLVAFVGDLARDVLLCLLVLFDLGDRFALGRALRLLHLRLAEGNDLCLVLVLDRDLLLELLNKLIKVALRHGLDLSELEEALDSEVLLEGLAALLEEVVSVVNVGRFEQLVLFFLLGVVLLVFVLHLSAVDLVLVIRLGACALLFLNQLVIKILELGEVGDDASLVLFVASLLEFVVVDFQNLKVILQTAQVAKRLIQRDNVV